MAEEGTTYYTMGRLLFWCDVRYQKLKTDFSVPASSKYVFKGLNAFVDAPRIIDGENYEEFIAEDAGEDANSLFQEKTTY